MNNNQAIKLVYSDENTTETVQLEIRNDELGMWSEKITKSFKHRLKGFALFTPC